ncbi:MAG TPA: hypothetical protein VMT46_00040 [Anaerolineaceae bacterium]|nr:hypothetical protein [Anaerolineaceae bacterium]
MNLLQSLRSRGLAATTLLVFAAAALLLFLFRDALRQVVLDPVLYLGWVAWLALNSVDQWILWVLLWLAALFIGLRGLFGGGRQVLPGAGADRRFRVAGRVSFWARQISGSERSDFFSEDARTSIRRLAYRALAPGEKPDRAGIEEAFRRGRLDLPPEILAYLLSPAPRQAVHPDPFWDWAPGWLLGLRERYLTRFDLPRALPVDPQAVRTLEFLEKQLDLEEKDNDETD